MQSENQNAPDVTVVVCAYRIGERIKPTIEAILNQSYVDFKLIVIDDASGDDTASAIRSFTDERLLLVENEENLGIIGARNKGLSLVETDYVATCDHDDVWQRGKLEKQVAYMREHPKCGLVGTYWTVYVNGMVDGVRTLPHTEPAYLKWSLYHRNCLLHSSLLMRTNHLKKHNIVYRDGLRFADDWKLCFDFAKTGEIGILPESLVDYFIHGENWSLTARENMHDNGVALMKEELSFLFERDVSDSEAETFFYAVAAGVPKPVHTDLKLVGHMLKQVSEADAITAGCSSSDAKNIALSSSEIWWRVVRTTAGVAGPSYLKAYGWDGCPNVLPVSFPTYCTEWIKAVLKATISKLKT
tara:strand:+ start:965 stop:2035 length:1071 start_codon:yes stop_codon:yes gene_type:complete